MTIREAYTILRGRSNKTEHDFVFMKILSSYHPFYTYDKNVYENVYYKTNDKMYGRI